MADRAKKLARFGEILEKSSQVDEIFKDEGTPPGSNPFYVSDEEHVEIDHASAEYVGTEDHSNVLAQSYQAMKSIFALTNKDCTFEELISEILGIATQAISVEAGSFIEVDYENQNLFFRSVCGRSSKNLLSLRFPYGSGVAGFCCQTKSPILVTSVEDSQMYLHAISASVGFEAKNVITVPVIIRDAVFGCIELLNKESEAAFSEADLHVLQNISDAASVVIENRLILASLIKNGAVALAA